MLCRRASGRRDRRHRLYALALTWQHQPQEIVMQRTRAIRMTNHAHKSLDIAREPRFNVLSFGEPHAKPPCSNANRLLDLSLGSDPDLPEEFAHAGAEGVVVHNCSAECVLTENFGASPERNFNFATRAIGRECQVNATAELVRDEIADEAGAITGSDRGPDRWAAKLAPCDCQDRRPIGAGAMPAHRHAAIRAR